MNKIQTILFLIALLPFSLFSQITGDYSISFAVSSGILTGDSIHIYFHVPANYTSAQATKMIIGFHGLGDPNNSTEIRNYLSPVGDSLSAIVMCPDPYLQDEPKTRAALNLAIDSAQVWFNMDMKEIYLAGYSAGSDQAAHYALESPEHAIKGLIWHSPGFYATPNMTNQAEFPPVCLCWGNQDFVSIIQANTLNSTFSNSSVPYLYNVISGVAHTMNYNGFPDEVLECINFIDANTVGVSENISRENIFTLYPNPANQFLNISLNKIAGENISIQFYNQLGKLIKEFTVLRKSTDAKLKIDCSELAVGLYLMKVESTEGTGFQKVFIQH